MKKTLITILISMVVGALLLYGYSVIHVWHLKAIALDKAIAQQQTRQSQQVQQAPALPAK